MRRDFVDCSDPQVGRRRPAIIPIARPHRIFERQSYLPILNLILHLEAAIRLSNSRVHLRFLDEADVLLALSLPTAAVLVASVVLESLLADPREQGAPEVRQRMEKWLELRNTVAHAHVATASLDQAKEMVEDVRRFLTREIKVGPRLVPSKPPAEAPSRFGESTSSCPQAPPNLSAERRMSCGWNTMSTVIDASALIAFLRDEPGTEAVQNLLSFPQTCCVH